MTNLTEIKLKHAYFVNTVPMNLDGSVDYKQGIAANSVQELRFLTDALLLIVLKRTFERIIVPINNISSVLEDNTEAQSQARQMQAAADEVARTKAADEAKAERLAKALEEAENPTPKKRRTLNDI